MIKASPGTVKHRFLTHKLLRQFVRDLPPLWRCRRWKKHEKHPGVGGAIPDLLLLTTWRSKVPLLFIQQRKIFFLYIIKYSSSYIGLGNTIKAFLTSNDKSTLLKTNCEWKGLLCIYGEVTHRQPKCVYCYLSSTYIKYVVSSSVWVNKWMHGYSIKYIWW